MQRSDYKVIVTTTYEDNSQDVHTISGMFAMEAIEVYKEWCGNAIEMVRIEIDEIRNIVVEMEENGRVWHTETYRNDQE